MLGPNLYRFLANAVVVVLGVALATAQQPAPTGAYTAAQANAGRAAYQTNCAGCHQPDLSGSFEAAPLKGANFLSAWGNRAASELFTRIRTTMPADNPGSLSDPVAVSIVAYILQSNGVSAGTQTLTPTTAAQIGSLAGGTTAQAATAPPAAGQAPAAPGPAPGQAPPARRGLTVAGEVRNYVPVTDEMLLHPDPADWLIMRGNYQAWSYSPLTQITRDNVGELRLAWV